MATLLDCMRYAKEHKVLSDNEKEVCKTTNKSSLEKMFFIKHISWERPNDVPIIGHTKCANGPHFNMPVPTTTYDAFMKDGYVVSVVVVETVFDNDNKPSKTIDHLVKDFFGPKY